ncbi:MAG: hypothetical protein HFH60_10030 [Lachnospiraceae bacterium]|nr:hypothetical protein [Lachnospiraceae bacterium]
MLNVEKVKIMTKLAAYEKGEGRSYLPISKYYRTDYIGLAMIKNFFLISIAYAVLAALVSLYFLDELLENIHKMDLVGLGVKVIIGYIVLLIAYSVLVYVIQTVKYSRAKKSIKNYYMQLGRLTKIYAKEEKRVQSRNVFRRDKI